REIAHPGLHLARVNQDIQVVNRNTALVGLNVARQDLDCGRFASAVRAEQTDNFPCADFEVDSAQGFYGAIRLRQIFGLNHRQNSTTVCIGCLLNFTKRVKITMNYIESVSKLRRYCKMSRPYH